MIRWTFGFEIGAERERERAIVSENKIMITKDSLAG